MTRIELLLSMRRGEALLVMLAIPLGILVFFSTLDIIGELGERPVDFLVPGVLALAVVSTAMAGLGIATGFERQQGVLKRLGATPLGRGGLLAAKGGTVICMLAVQAVAIVVTGWALGWRPAGSLGMALTVGIMGAASFAGIGFLMAGRLRAETNLAAANGLFLVMLLLGGIVAPIERLPGLVQRAAMMLPAEPLATALRGALTGTVVPGRAVATLGVWAVGACTLAVLTFRWEP